LITITRHAARRLRAMLRRSVLGITHRGALPPLVLHAESQHLRAQYRYHGLAIEYVEANSHRVLDSIPVPLGALADLEAHEETPVVIAAAVAPPAVPVQVHSPASEPNGVSRQSGNGHLPRSHAERS